MIIVKQRRKFNMKIWNDIWGWGEIVMESNNYYVVRWDSNPWTLEQVPKD